MHVYMYSKTKHTSRERARCSASRFCLFYPFNQFCEIIFSLLSLQKQPNAAPNLFQRGVEYGKYVHSGSAPRHGKT